VDGGTRPVDRLRRRRRVRPVGAQAGRLVRPGRYLVHGILSSWQLTLPLPPGLAVVPVALAASAWAAGALTLLWRPGSVAAALPAVVVAACGTGAAGTTRFSWLSALIGLVALGLLLSGVRLSSLRVLASAAAVAVATVSLAWSVHSPGPRADPRARVVAPARIDASTDLLDRVGGWLSDPKTVLFRASATPAVDRWRLGVLDDVRSDRWTDTAPLRLARLGVPLAAGIPPGETEVRQHIALTGLEGPFLPAADRPFRVTALVTAVDPDSGVLVGVDTETPGSSYDVVSHVLAADSVPASAAAAPGPAVDLAVPEVLKPDLQHLLDEAGVPATAPAVERARLLTDYLARNRRNVTGAPSGGDLAAVRKFIGGGDGTSTQFAATFALAMRTAGIPARLVVGFVPARSGATEVTAGDVRVWAELNYAGLGWRTYDVTPPAVPGRHAPTPADIAAVTPPIAADPPAATPEPNPDAGPADRHALGLIVPIVALLLYALAIKMAPAVRRARRRWAARTPAARVVAAWHDVIEQLGLDRRARDHLTPTTASALIPASGANDTLASWPTARCSAPGPSPAPTAARRRQRRATSAIRSGTHRPR
jgi:hypothetical protein